MRPRYCTERDRQNEQVVLDTLVNFLTATAKQHLWRVQSAPKNAPCDGTVFRDDKLTAIVEIKNRKGCGDRFDTWHIAKHKIDACRAMAKSLGVRFLLVMNWEEGGVYFIAGNDIPMNDIREGGRTDRNDPFDVELMVHIPRNLFKKL